MSLYLDHHNFERARRALLLVSGTLISLKFTPLGVVLGIPVIETLVAEIAALQFTSKVLIGYLLYVFVMRSGDVRMTEDRITSEFITGFSLPLGVAIFALLLV